MLTIKELAVKNFMSVGNATQSINFANKNSLQIIGSYDPEKAGCLSVEFHDYIHPNTICINKIINK